MHIAVAMGTMLLSSWVLNSPDTQEQAGTPGEVQQQEMMPTSPTSPATPKLPYSFSAPRPGSMDQSPTEGLPEGEHRNMQRGSSSSGGGSSMRPQMPMYMPTAPTDNSTDVFGIPTSGPGSNRMRAIPTAPTSVSSLAPRSDFDSKLKSPLTQNRGPAAFGNVSAAPSPASQKAFAGYQPTSGVSPYMNLFRIGGETIDNYTSLVRPQIEQRFLNQQFNRDIRGLDNAAQNQRVNLQQLYRANQTLQGVATPQYYMNYGSYYSGSGSGVPEGQQQ